MENDWKETLWLTAGALTGLLFGTGLITPLYPSVTAFVLFKGVTVGSFVATALGIMIGKYVSEKQKK